jgi:hypothetical protein
MYTKHPGDDPWSSYPNISRGYWRNSPVKIDVKAIIEPLLKQIKRLDKIRLTLEKDGGSRHELKELNSALTSETILKSSFGSGRASFNDPATIQVTLRDVGCTNIHFEVRRLKNGMPAYFLGRLKNDFRGSTPLILEKLHLSPGFPIADKRFIRLMRHGHERFYLNLAPYRQLLDLDENKRDDLLYRIGQHILLAAWHEDQYPGLMTAELLRLHSFPIAVELLYLILSSELSNLRHCVDKTTINFFEHICPQPAIAGFLRHLPKIKGNNLAQLPALARKHYKSLATGFGKLLQTKIRWGSRGSRIELYKILFGNFSRPEALAEKLPRNETLNDAAYQLEKRANKLIAELTVTTTA